jgi:hypothetical protein
MSLHRILPRDWIATTLVFAVLVPAAPQAQIGIPRSGWFLEPDRVQSGQGFNLQFLNQKYGNCQTTFTNASIRVARDTILAEFKAVTDTSIICIIDIRPWGPSFKMEALTVGSYPVFVREMRACEPLCQPVNKFELADTLVVSSDPPWPSIWVLPEQAKPGAAFDLELWSNGYPCGATLTDKEVQITRTGMLRLSYTVTMRDIICLPVIRDEKQTFSVTGLAAGTWYVYLDPRQPCPERAGFLCNPAHALRPVDSLNVRAGAAILPHVGGQGSRVVWSAGHWRLTLPGKGPFELDLLSLSGKRLQSFRAAEGNGASVDLRPARKLGPGLYWLQFRSATGRGALKALLPEG